jgi:hypothetical protein
MPHWLGGVMPRINGAFEVERLMLLNEIIMNPAGGELTVTAGVPLLTERVWWKHLLWVLAGAVLGFLVASVFAGLLHLPRSIYLIPYVLLVAAFLYGYVRWSKLAVGRCVRRRWGWGLLGGIIAGVFVVQSVLRQPSSSAPRALELVVDLSWLGIVYGAVDGLLLSVLPVLAVWEAMTTLGWTVRWPGRAGTGLLSLLASIIVVAAYHFGYPEFRGQQVMFPVFGVGVMSLAYIITGNPISAVISHVAMHMAAVLHGLQTVIQLPPHY